VAAVTGIRHDVLADEPCRGADVPRHRVRVGEPADQPVRRELPRRRPRLGLGLGRRPEDNPTGAGCRGSAADVPRVPEQASRRPLHAAPPAVHRRVRQKQHRQSHRRAAGPGAGAGEGRERRQVDERSGRVQAGERILGADAPSVPGEPGARVTPRPDAAERV